ncbi:MAG: hypothetical protein A2X13_02485 [Bacteroidetes bacterium GWC2_33_15]|nr:MAG: hypothetical protein A2X10_14930 [Bacteroidetes bacterium GWA2_33_15]OFX49362.1 MAG: hypothetical protein A2X13_02485 [Bacteroidetes bacterium GWC2_33_15]OFX63045.1 MAG: hypothetical protein A2X15_10385 [Bacteroidetes bacterium GWB2_32_14]OFX68710.1 MAG: hypothetical protein A2X14_14010 [Bacteroidetes bacterium GWD2_33_33]HAN19123.1 hypothetical protein [Bacteroidales bacterium]
MKDFSIISVSIINLLIGIRYCILIYKKEIKPALAMWIFFTLAVVMSLITYLADGNYSIWDNILNTTDILLVSTVSVFIYIYGDKSSKFNKFDTVCLIAVLLIIIFWIISRNHVITNLLIQLILVIAYFPVIKRLIKSKENTEPFTVWIGMMLAPVFALISSKGALATIYSVRAIICVGLLLLLMLRVQYLYRKNSPG